MIFILLCVCVKDVRVQWQTVFFITSAFYVFSTTFYVLCGSGKLQRWALVDSRQLRADGLSPPLRSSDIAGPPQSTVVRQFSSPASVFSAGKPGSGSSDPYSNDSLRRKAELSADAARAGAPNHLSPSTVVGDDSDELDRKLSGKSTSSSKTARGDDAAPARHIDHDRDHQPRVRRDQNLSKRHAKPSQSKPATTLTLTTTAQPPTTPDEGLRIYESLSESPV